MKIIILEQAFVLYVKVLYDVIIQTFFSILQELEKHVEVQIHLSLQ